MEELREKLEEVIGLFDHDCTVCEREELDQLEALFRTEMLRLIGESKPDTVNQQQPEGMNDDKTKYVNQGRAYGFTEGIFEYEQALIKGIGGGK